jgi:hypothetical protein
MLYARRKRGGRTPGGFYQLESAASPQRMFGFGEGGFVRLRDENGETWQGSVEVENESTVRYRFRNTKGRSISGLSDSGGILLRDERGNTWRGFVF